MAGGLIPGSRVKLRGLSNGLRIGWEEREYKMIITNGTIGTVVKITPGFGWMVEFESSYIDVYGDFHQDYPIQISLDSQYLEVI